MWLVAHVVWCDSSVMWQVTNNTLTDVHTYVHNVTLRVVQLRRDVPDKIWNMCAYTQMIHGRKELSGFIYLHVCMISMPDILRASLLVAELLEVIPSRYIHEHLLQTVGPAPGFLRIRSLLSAGMGARCRVRLCGVMLRYSAVEWDVRVMEVHAKHAYYMWDAKRTECTFIN